MRHQISQWLDHPVKSTRADWLFIAVVVGSLLLIVMTVAL